VQLDVYFSDRSYGSGKPRRYAFLASGTSYEVLPKSERWTHVRSGEIAEFQLPTKAQRRLTEKGFAIEVCGADLQPLPRTAPRGNYIH
jgi:hypothetical protein